MGAGSKAAGGLIKAAGIAMAIVSLGFTFFYCRNDYFH